MSTSTKTGSRKRRWLTILIIISAAAVVLFVTASLGAGYGLNLRGFGRMLLNTTLAVANSGAVARYNSGEYRNIVFLHHSVGAHLIEQGGLREKFTAAGYSFWDQGYNTDQLRDPTGRKTGYAYPVPRDSTEPIGLAQLFAQPTMGLPLTRSVAFSNMRLLPSSRASRPVTSQAMLRW